MDSRLYALSRKPEGCFCRCKRKQIGWFCTWHPKLHFPVKLSFDPWQRPGKGVNLLKSICFKGGDPYRPVIKHGNGKSHSERTIFECIGGLSTAKFGLLEGNSELFAAPFLHYLHFGAIAKCEFLSKPNRAPNPTGYFRVRKVTYLVFWVGRFGPTIAQIPPHFTDLFSPASICKHDLDALYRKIEFTGTSTCHSHTGSEGGVLSLNIEPNCIKGSWPLLLGVSKRAECMTSEDFTHQTGCTVEYI